MKKILLVAPYYLTSKEVGGAFTYQFITKLINTGTKVDYVSYHYEEDISEPPMSKNFRVIKDIKLSMLDKFISWLQCPIFHPLFTSRFSWHLVHFLNKNIKKNNYDFVVFDYSQSFTLARYVKHPHKILIAHDVISQRFERENSKFVPWIRWTEGRLFKGAEKVYSFSLKDCILIKQKYGVDCDHTPVFIKEDILNKHPSKIGEYHVFFADWGRKDNSESLEWFLDNIIKEVNDEQFKIIGGHMPQHLNARIKMCSNIEYLGFVDDPYQIIANAKSEICPLHKGAGIKVKCLEAMACGTPVIGTDVAFEGISSHFSKYLLRAHTVGEYVKAIKTINMSIEEKDELKEDFLMNYSQRSVINYIQNN